jgi:hypothetical protein
LFWSSGAISGCGGAFLPFNKGLNPIKASGLAPPMMTALVGATFFHLFVNLAGVVDAKQKAHVIVAAWFVISGYYYNGLFSVGSSSPSPIKTDSAKKKKK